MTTPVVHHRRLKFIELTIGDVSFECQVKSWTLDNATEDGERFFTFCPDGEFYEEADDKYSLKVTIFADWRSAGFSTFLVEHDQEEATFTLDHHPDIDAEHVRWTGTLKVKAPPVGGDSRATEMTEVTLPCIGKPTYSRPGDSS